MTQYYSRTDIPYAGDSNFTIPFSYIDKTDIHVYINDTLISTWVWLNDSQINITSTLSTGDVVSIRRITPIDEKIVTYQNMSMVLNDDNLNLSQDQVLNAVQEVYDNNVSFQIDVNAQIDEIDTKVDTANATANQALSNSGTAISIANEALSNSEDAIATANAAETKADNAVSTANTASSNASQAVSTANEANTNAQAAVSTANSAADDASEALLKANTAISTANTAKDTADTAKDTADEALADSATALANSETAISTANDAADDATEAVATANTANTNASNAVSTANSASSAANSAVSTANSASTTANNAVSTANTASTNASAAIARAEEAIEIAQTAVSQGLTPATTTTLGGIKVGNNLSITADGTLSADAQSIVVDSALSTTSVNPVQNKVITGVLNNKQDKLTAGTDLEIVNVGTYGLPNGYTLLEWVESNGLQSLSLGFSGNCTIEFTAQMAHIPTNNEVLLTSSVGASAGTWFGVNSDNTWSYSEISGSTKIDVVMNATAQGLNGTINSNTFSRNVPATHGTWTLFNNIPTSDATTFPSFMKLFALKVTQNSTIIRNLIPCKNSNNVVGLYDTINSVFYSSTSGTQLIAGTVIPTGNIINFTNESGYALQTDVDDALALKQDLLTAGTDLEIVEGSTFDVPDDYTQVEYLNMPEGSYIDTGITKSDFTYPIINTKFRRIKQNDADMFGTKVSENGMLVWDIAGNSPYLRYGRTTSAQNVTYQSGHSAANDLTFTTAKVLTFGGNASATPIYVDGVLIGTVGTTQPDFSVLSATNSICINKARSANSNCEWHYFRIYDYDMTLVYEGVPVKRNLDGVLGMYDTVSGTFKTNEGTGNFVAGEEIPDSTVIRFTNESGYIKGINSSDVITALGYTPYNASNPDGYTSNVGTVTSVNNELPDANGNVTIQSGSTPNDGVLTLKQNNTTLGTFTANQSGNTTINIPASGSSHWEQGGSGLSLVFDHSQVVDVLYDNNNYIAISEEGRVYTSADGVTWNYDHAMLYEQLDYYFWKSICYGNGIYLAMNQAGYYSTSTDLSTLGSNAMTTPTPSLSWVSVAFGKGNFVALRDSGYIKTSTDGITWTTATQVANLGNNNWQSIIFGGDKFIALSENGYISTSTNGTTWTVATQNYNLGANSWRDLSYNGGQYIAVSHTGYYSTSTDGTTWTVATQIGTSTTDSVTYANNKFLVATTGGGLRWFVLSAQDLLYTKANTDLSNTTDSAKVMMAGASMPSSLYVDVTLGASGATYQAPANGWYTICSNSNGTYPKSIELINSSGGDVNTSVTAYNNNKSGWLRCSLPVKKGDIVACYYNNMSVQHFRFVYAQGSGSEA